MSILRTLRNRGAIHLRPLYDHMACRVSVIFALSCKVTIYSEVEYRNLDHVEIVS